MPIHNVGYRGWIGKLTAQWTRWQIIAVTGITIALRGKLIKRMLFVSWLPVLYLGMGFFFFEKLVENDQLQAGAQMTPDEKEWAEFRQASGESGFRQEFGRQNNEFLNVLSRSRNVPKIDRVQKAITSGDTKLARHTTWNWLLMTFMRYPQGTLMLFMMGLIVPPLISRDLRSRAYLLYFSKPIGRIEYILGKLAIPACFLVMITAFPAFALYAFGVMLSPDFSVLLDTWDIPIRIMISTAVLVIPTSSLALMYSSLTHESRFAGFAWFATWALGGCAYLIIWAFTNTGGQVAISNTGTNWSVISIYHTIGIVQEWIFGLEPNFYAVLPSTLVLASITVFSLLVLYRKVSAPINA